MRIVELVFFVLPLLSSGIERAQTPTTSLCERYGGGLNPWVANFVVQSRFREEDIGSDSEEPMYFNTVYEKT